jgi:hypothetical protein
MIALLSKADGVPIEWEEKSSESGEAEEKIKFSNDDWCFESNQLSSINALQMELLVLSQKRHFILSSVDYSNEVFSPPELL